MITEADMIGFDFCVKIYTLSTLSGIVFYVGCTVMPVEHRLRQHISSARTGSDPNKIKSKVICDNNFKIIITIVEMVPVKAERLNLAPNTTRAKCAEQKWISKFISDGCVLTNRVTGKRDREKERREVYKKEFVGKQVMVN